MGGGGGGGAHTRSLISLSWEKKKLPKNPKFNGCQGARCQHQMSSVTWLLKYQFATSYICWPRYYFLIKKEQCQHWKWNEQMCYYWVVHPSLNRTKTNQCTNFLALRPFFIQLAPTWNMFLHLESLNILCFPIHICKVLNKRIINNSYKNVHL